MATNNRKTTKPAAKKPAQTVAEAKTSAAIAEDVLEVIETVEEDTTEEVVIEAPKAEVVRPARRRAAEPLPETPILCRSVTGGELLLPAKKSGALYIWSNYGDTVDVEFQDLKALKSSRSAYIYNPMFVIEDEEVCELWERDLAPIYDRFSNIDDIESLFTLSNVNFRQALIEAPIGIKNTIKVVASEKVQSGELDSIAKINILDEILDTELKLYVK